MGGYAVPAAPPDRRPGALHGLINDFHEWTAWSPWEDLDPDLQRDLLRAGHRRRGALRLERQPQGRAGRMEITASTPDEIDVRLTFLKPWKATNQVGSPSPRPSTAPR